MRAAWLSFLLALVVLLSAGRGLADEPAAEARTDGEHAAGHQGQPAGHGKTAEHGGHDAHGEHLPGPINWGYGFVGERENVQPSLLWRPKGMPAPLGALILNTLILVFVFVRYGAKPVSDALKKRKETIMRGMDDAARMKEEAAERLAEYEEKLEHIDDEVERVKREMREAGEAERTRILAEAKDRRERMERDASLLVEQELKATRERLIRETVQGAIESARKTLESQLTPADQQRLAEEYVAGIEKTLSQAGGGRA